MHKTRITSLLLFAISLTSICLFPSCTEEEVQYADAIENRDSLPMLMSIGVSTLISDSGIISYRLITEDWYLYDRTRPRRWSFEKGLFMEKFNKSFEIEAYINCDTAYYNTDDRIWELRGRVSVRNSRGETFKTSKLFWDQTKKMIYSDQYMEINGIDRRLSGYNFYSNEQMTDYEIHSSKGAFPVSENPERPHPDPSIMSEMSDTTASETSDIEDKPVDDSSNSEKRDSIQ